MSAMEVLELVAAAVIGEELQQQRRERQRDEAKQAQNSQS